MNTSLEHLLHKRLVWSAKQQQPPTEAHSSGYPELDDLLSGGFPTQGVMTLNTPVGIGELRLLLPYLEQQSQRQQQQQQKRQLAFIAPPFALNAEMLTEAGIALEDVLIVTPKSQNHRLWATEQCLKSGSCHSVLLWENKLQIHQVKRFQLASQQGQCLTVILQTQQVNHLALPVTLGLKLFAKEQGIGVQIDKQKGAWSRDCRTINMSSRWPELTLSPKTNNVIPFQPRQRA